MTADTVSLEPEPGLRPLDPEIERRIAELPAGVRVLDWGCGYGGATLDLLRAGVDVYGVDVDPERIAWGREQLSRAGYPGDDRLVALENGRAPLPERSFDFVFSQDVLEHIADLDPAIAEIARLTAPHGLGVHTFPARWLVREAHTKLPFVHWLPKGGLRRRLTHAWLLVGVGRAPRGRFETRRELTDAVYLRTTEQFFYRFARAITRAFDRHGLRAEVVTRDHYRLRPLPGPLRRPAGWAVTNFYRVVVATRAD